MKMNIELDELFCHNTDKIVIDEDVLFTEEYSSSDIKELKEKLSKLYKERKVNDEKIKQARKKSILYNRANKPIITAQKTLARYESYNSYINNLV